MGVVLLLAGQLVTAEEPGIVTVTADGVETAYALAAVDKIVFAKNDNTTMTVNMKDDAPVTDVVRIYFDAYHSATPTLASSAVFVFPNPVTAKLTVSGVDADTKINLHSVNGTLLQSIPAQDNATDIDVSSLPAGIYLLCVGAQTYKFIKK